MDKCIWGVNSTEYLGFIVDKTGINPKESYIKKILDVPVPTAKSGLQRFIGLVQYLHRHLPHLDVHVAKLSPLTADTGPNKIKLTDEQLIAFNSLKKLCQNAKYLFHPDLEKPFHLFTDASKYGIGGMLAQMDKDGTVLPISYCSKVFNDVQTRWHCSEQELHASIYCIEKWGELLRYNKFTLHTDHKNLEKLFNQATDFKNGKLYRWSVRIQDYDFCCKYIKGKDNLIADYLSRESVLLQHPTKRAIAEFYDSKPTADDIAREKLSNNDGVDIHSLYMQHYRIESMAAGCSLSKYYDEYFNPYESLQDEYQRHISSLHNMFVFNKTKQKRNAYIKNIPKYYLPPTQNVIDVYKQCKTKSERNFFSNLPLHKINCCQTGSIHNLSLQQLSKLKTGNLHTLTQQNIDDNAHNHNQRIEEDEFNQSMNDEDAQNQQRADDIVNGTTSDVEFDISSSPSFTEPVYGKPPNKYAHADDVSSESSSATPKEFKLSREFDDDEEILSKCISVND